MSVIIETTLGDITVDLYIKHRSRACYNFLKLCKIKYYNYCLVFDIKKDYALRTGDPDNTGEHGESIYNFDYPKEKRRQFFSADQNPIIKHTKLGQIAMVNNGKNKYGSQFLITLAKNLDYLDKQNHLVFGEVVEGLEVLSLINKQLVDRKDHPYRDICISHTVIIDDPFEDPAFIREKNRSESPKRIPEFIKNSDRVGICDDLNEDEGKTEEEIKKEHDRKEAELRSILLEMVGDIPQADVKPPENVLFICKLNPITEEDDLRRIFSRFGTIESVQIVKDPKSGQSLQYGFIEFEDKESCEKAYLKMDNVLIDDRRIHVDFSQSVSKKRRYH